MLDLTVLGELLIDFTPEGQNPSGMLLFSRNPGGAVANVTCTVTRLGHTAAFCGKVGDDMHGRFLRDTLRSYDVDTEGLVLDPAEMTTLAFVTLEPDGERSFSFCRNPGADTRLRPDEINPAQIQASRILHVGSLSMTDEPAASATRSAVAVAREAGVLVSFDPNYRELLWRSRDEAIRAMLELYSQADLVKFSREEAQMCFPRGDISREMPELFADRKRWVVVTDGSNGAFVHGPGEVFHVPAISTEEIVDTTGAGDIFWGAFLVAFLTVRRNVDDLTLKDVCEFAVFGTVCAALSLGKHGAIPSIPSRENILSVLQNAETATRGTKRNTP